jgi:serine/threonine protein kinase
VALKYFSPRPGVPALAHTMQLVHPHIVGLLNFTYLPGGDCYLIFEYVAGGTLRERMNENPISETADALAITRDLLSAPAQIHRDGSAHCDIKPKNILRSVDPNDRRVIDKLADFGLARRLAAVGPTTESSALLPAWLRRDFTTKSTLPVTCTRWRLSSTNS